MNLLPLSLFLSLILPCIGQINKASYHNTGISYSSSRKTEPQVAPLKRRASGQPRIVGGKDAPNNTYTWMAALVNSSENNLFLGQFCGGTLVHPEWIVTAAHCVIGRQPESLDIVLGAHDLRNPVNVQRIEVSEIILHPSYLNTGDTLNYDIALLRLKTPAQTRFTPLPIADSEALNADGTMARTIGWGNTSSSTNLFPSILQEVDLPLVNLSVANATTTYSQRLTNQMLAAGLAQGGIDSCQGDSGGPLMVPAPFDTGWALGGIVSFGAGCAQPNAFGIYSRVTELRGFLFEHISADYFEWEKNQNAIGERRDQDGDGFHNYAEFAFQMDNATADTPLLNYAAQNSGGTMMQGLSFQRARNNTGIDYIIQQSADLDSNNWSTFTLDSLVINESDIASIPDAIETTATLPLSANEPRSFFRVSAETNSSSRLRILNAPGGASGYLTDGDSPHPDNANRSQKTYKLAGLTSGQEITISGRSTSFNIILELLESEVVIQTADQNSGIGFNGHDEFLTFTPEMGKEYFLRISSTLQNGSGFYELGCFDPNSTPTNIAIGVNVFGSLTSSDENDPGRLPNSYKRDLYFYQEGPLPQYLGVTANSSNINSEITIINAESGRTVNFGSFANGQTIRFRSNPGSSYIIQISSRAPNDFGSYGLTLNTDPSTTTNLTIPTVLNRSLSTSDDPDPISPLRFKDDYIIQNATVGDSITVSLESTSFDALLVIIDAYTGNIITADDDSGIGFDSLLSFEVSKGIEYMIRVTSAIDSQTGSYTLRVN